MAVSTFKGQKFAVLGLGKSGLSTAEYLRAHEADVTVWDDEAAKREAAEKSGFTVGNLTKCDAATLVMSPGIPHTFPKPHPVSAHFRDKKLPIIGDIELLFRANPDATYVGITGTNGKSTTTALIGHILKQAGKTVEVGGNLGTPALSLNQLGKNGIYVLELSSYQLELIEHNPISVAILLNLTPDHIERHGSMAGYAAAKSRIISSDVPQTLIIGKDEAETRAIAAEARTRKNVKVEEIDSDSLRNIVDPVTLPTLPGRHNAQNAVAAFLACRALHIPEDKIIEGLRSFPGLEHRQQIVSEIEGVRFINDSKATNADAASKALACYKNIYWIIGGLPKAGGLHGLESFAPRIRHAFIIGQASDAFADWCRGKLPYSLCGKLDVAVAKAAEMAWEDKNPDSVVLLSPACASWDQFKSFEDRGNQFKELCGGFGAKVKG